jgi:PiT family inorganic phosphate transporter
MGGAALAAGAPVLWPGVLDKIVIPMVVSPIVGLILGYFLMVAIMWIFGRQRPGRAARGFRYAQTLSAAAMALGHGLQDAGKTMGIVVLALTVGGYQNGSSIPSGSRSPRR